MISYRLSYVGPNATTVRCIGGMGVDFLGLSRTKRLQTFECLLGLSSTRTTLAAHLGFAFLSYYRRGDSRFFFDHMKRDVSIS